MTHDETMAIYQEALDRWGIQSQTTMVMEETGEMLNALAKALRGRANNMEVITELADVSIMMEQMALLFGYEEYVVEKERKIKRLKERLEETEDLQ